MAKYCRYCASPILHGEECTNCNYESYYQPKPHQLRPGTLLNNRYLVGIAIGEGGFGITYMGRDLALDMKVAIKEYFPSALAARSSETTNYLSLKSETSGEEFISGRDRVLEEARTMAKMDKEDSVVTVHDFFEENNSAYIVMEFVEGRDLRAIMVEKTRPIAADELLRMLEPVFGALSGLHGMGLIHRDISPDNIMVENGKARLIDFGGSMPTADTSPEAIKKHRFSPAEQYRNEGMGPWTDVYSMAATIYYCITGKLPPISLERERSDTLRSPSSLGARLLPRQEKALLKALAVKPEDRYRSMEEFGRDLFVNRNKNRVIAVAAGLVAALAIGSLAVFRPNADTKALGVAYPADIFYGAEDNVSQVQKEQIRQAEQILNGSVTLSRLDEDAIKFSATNTTGIDLDGVEFYIRFLNRDGIVVDYNRWIIGRWAAGNNYKVQIMKYFREDVSADVKIYFNSEDKRLFTGRVPIELDEGKSGKNIILGNGLPCTLLCTVGLKEVQITITDMVLEGSRLLFSGQVTGGSQGEKFCHDLDYKLYTESGAVMDSGTLSLPLLSVGDSFSNCSVFVSEIPPGSYTMQLSDHKY